MSIPLVLAIRHGGGGGLIFAFAVAEFAVGGVQLFLGIILDDPIRGILRTEGGPHELWGKVRQRLRKAGAAVRGNAELK